MRASTGRSWVVRGSGEWGSWGSNVRRTYLHTEGSLMTLSVTCRARKVRGCIYHSLVKDARLTPSSASHCFMTSGAITPVHVASGIKREDVAGSTSCERCAPHDTSRDIQFAGEPMTWTRVSVGGVYGSAGGLRCRRSCRGRAEFLSVCKTPGKSVRCPMQYNARIRHTPGVHL